MRVPSASLVVALLSAVGLEQLPAQVSWTLRSPAVFPAVRFGHAMAYDSQRGVVVLHGGAVPNGSWVPQSWRNDTWEWNGVTWAQRLSASTPPPLPWPAMAYDSARGRSVMQGSIVGEVWEWDGTNWFVIQAPVGPPASVIGVFGNGRCMTYDSIRSRIVWVGSPASPTASVVETWEWDGTSWHDRTSPTSPPVPQAGNLAWSLAFDAARSRSVLSSGDETWEWDGVAWVWASGVGQGGLSRPMVFDSLHGRCTTHAGAGAWLWNGTYWIDVGGNGPPSLFFAGLAYDSARHVTVQFGGAAIAFQGGAETWERSAVLAATQVSVFGAGCGNPTPVLTPNPESPPAIGHTFVAEISNASLGIGFVAWGTSNSSWGPAALPLPLDPFGFEGCTLLQNGNIVLDAACSSTSWNTAVHSVPIPSIQGLVGQTFYLQAWTLQPGFNTNGIVTSNGIALTIGNI